MSERIARIPPSGEQVRICLRLQERVDEAKRAYDEAIALRNMYFYRIGSLDDIPKSPNRLARSLDKSVNHVYQLFNGMHLSIEQREQAGELSDDDPRLP